MLLPTVWLLVVVPVTYAHARWRGIRVTLWKWAGSALYLILCGLAAASVRHWLLGSQANWSSGDGHQGVVAMLLAAAVFLALETVLFSGSALLNHAEDEQWLRAMLTSPGFYATETCVLLLGGLFSMVWAAGFWFCLFFIPLLILIQQAVLLGPLRERAAVAGELAAKNAELEQANRFKSELMSMLGHEIGNPLTSVLGYSQLINETLAIGDAAGAKAAAEVVDRNGQRIAAVLADIIALVAGEQSGITADPQTVALAPALASAIAELPDADRAPLDCPPGLRAHVQPSHLDQILTNLLSNAIKYGGGVTRVTARSGPTGVEIAVMDDGPGVPEAFRDQLFERFQRDDATSASVTGMGLGLHISRELARANGGDLTHHGGDGVGSHFVLTLPAG